MVRVSVDPYSVINETIAKLNSGGLLLVSMGLSGVPNVMTIGWGLIGRMWREPFFIVAVRKSRYTHKLLEERGEFTVNVPSDGMDKVLEYCGTYSGRDHDKFKELGLTAMPSYKVSVPYIAQCPIHYECKVSFKVDVTPGSLEKSIEESIYPSGNYHTLYFGRILGVYVEESIASKILK
ncbi:MAG: flavin reductase family protein [Candidatus Verstraetearchaeota archaeon]|jgi:flavin reductase (DIM6/NTAB) family NADH-FMN oxidoreductase RutF|nr:flavin reductase family protein [Candidatus Verstraetearchaeota archaeon]